MEWVRIASRYVLATIFLYAGADKAFHYGGFVNALRGYVVLPREAVPFLGWPIILCELFIGVSLLVRPWRSRAALSASGLLGLFTLALVVNQRFAPGTLCGCWFTVTLGRSTPLHVVQNLVLLGLAISVWMGESFRSRLNSAAGKET